MTTQVIVHIVITTDKSIWTFVAFSSSALSRWQCRYFNVYRSHHDNSEKRNEGMWCKREQNLNLKPYFNFTLTWHGQDLLEDKLSKFAEFAFSLPSKGFRRPERRTETTMSQRCSCKTAQSAGNTELETGNTELEIQDIQEGIQWSRDAVGKSHNDFLHSEHSPSPRV